MKVKEFIETLVWTEYQVSGQTYTKDLRGKEDLEDKMNDFLKDKIIKIIELKYGNTKRKTSGFSTPVDLSTALLIYDEV